MSVAMKAMPGFKFGCDPELFVVNSNGDYVSAEGLLPGTKAEPYPVPYGAIQVDGMAAEFNIDPAYTFEEFNQHIVYVMATLKKMLPKGYGVLPAPSVTFNEEIWAAAPDKAKELGCTPDFNAWTGEVNPPPEDLENPRLRTASGHLHIGWTEDADMSDVQHIMNCRDLVKQLDWYLGAWSLKIDEDSTRRRLYGKAGACRFKPYGVEYRVLSNFWLMNVNRRRAVWDRMQQAIWDMRTNFLPGSKEAFVFNDLVVKSINSSTRDKILERKFAFPLTTLEKATLVKSI